MTSIQTTQQDAAEISLAQLGEAFGLDFETMLAPFSTAKPCGPDAREYTDETAEASAAYRQLKSERAAARTIERSACFDEVAQGAAPAAQAHWQNILAQAPDFLANHSKDLEVVAWVLEALLRLHGLAGFNAGLRFAAQMVSDFEAQLYPQPDEDGIETQVAPLSGLNGDGTEGTLIRPLRLLPLTEMNNQAQCFSYSDYQIAADIDGTTDPDRREQREAEAPFILSDIRQAMATSADGFCLDLQQALVDALAGLADLSDALYAVFGVESPPTSLIKNTLLEMQQVVSDLLQGRVLTESSDAGPEPVVSESKASSAESPPLSASASGDVSPNVAPAGAFTPGPIPSREAALTQLTQIAEYFRASEPHSPMAGVLDRAIRWGRMPIEQLIMELLPEDSARQIFSQLTGISAQAGAGGAASVVAPVVAAPVATPAAPETNGFDQNFSQTQTNSEGVW